MAKDLEHLRLPPKRPRIRTTGRFTFGGFEFSAGRQDAADDPAETTPSESFDTPDLHGAITANTKDGRPWEESFSWGFCYLRISLWSLHKEG